MVIKPLFLALFAITSMPMLATAADKPKLSCAVGPTSIQLGGAEWIVQSCDDELSLVFVTAAGNPAMPFVFFRMMTEGGIKMSGEGTGDKAFTSSAWSELKRMSKDDFSKVLALTLETERLKRDDETTAKP